MMILLVLLSLSHVHMCNDESNVKKNIHNPSLWRMTPFANEDEDDTATVSAYLKEIYHAIIIAFSKEEYHAIAIVNSKKKYHAIVIVNSKKIHHAIILAFSKERYHAIVIVYSKE